MPKNKKLIGRAGDPEGYTPPYKPPANGDWLSIVWLLLLLVVAGPIVAVAIAAESAWFLFSNLICWSKHE